MNKCLSTKDWLITLLIMAIPIVGIIMLLVWAFGGSQNCRSNYAKAVLIWYVIILVLSIVFSVLFTALAATLFSGFGF